MNAERVILRALANKRKPPLVKMRNWSKAEKRPSEHAIVPWEVYSNPKNLLTEKQVINTLQSLERRGVVKISKKEGWWELK